MSVLAKRPPQIQPAVVIQGRGARTSHFAPNDASIAPMVRRMSTIGTSSATMLQFIG